MTESRRETALNFLANILNDPAPIETNLRIHAATMLLQAEPAPAVDGFYREMISQLGQSLETLGAKSDLLCIVGSLASAKTYDEARAQLAELREWNSLNGVSAN